MRNRSSYQCSVFSFLEMGIVFLFLCLMTSLSLGQMKSTRSFIQRDTSFTVFSSYDKLIRDYPNIRPVTAAVDSQIMLHKEVPYSFASGRLLMVDIIMPSGNGHSPFPVLLLIHGGGWRSGERAMERPTAIALAKRGYACVLVEYRLSTEALFPAALTDIQTALRWVRHSAADYQFDTNHVALYGCSSGGHLASLVSMSQWLHPFPQGGEYLDHTDAVHAVIDVDGVLDFTDPAESGKDTDQARPSAGKQWLGCAMRENPQLWRDASPQHYLASQNPPMLFINSSIPRFHAGRDSVIAFFKEKGIYAEVHTIAQSPHPFWLFHPWFDEEIVYQIAFLKKIFGR